MLPLIAALINMGLPMIAGAIATKGKDVIQDKLGIDISSAMGTEEGKLKLLQAQHEHEEFLVNAAMAKTEQDIKEAALYIGDVGNARDREAKIATSEAAPLLNKIITPILACTILALTFLIFYVVTFSTGAVDASRKDIMIYVLGVLSAIATQIVQYYFGSSKGSSAKDETINMMQQQGNK